MDTIEPVISKSKPAVNTSLVYILVSVLASAIGQILLKEGMIQVGVVTLSAGQLLEVVRQIITNPFVIVGLMLYAAGALFWLAALSRVDLSYAYPFVSLSYIFMLIASWQIFDETITPLRLVGTVIIAVGVFLVSRS